MLLLTGTATALRLEVVSGTGSLGFGASYADQNATTGAFVGTQGSINATITSGDSVIVAAPSAGVSRNIKQVMVFNHSPTDSSVINIYLFATPTANTQWRGTLAPYESVLLDDCGVWTYYAAGGTKK